MKEPQASASSSNLQMKYMKLINRKRRGKLGYCLPPPIIYALGKLNDNELTKGKKLENLVRLLQPAIVLIFKLKTEKFPQH
jgi:hypothetical protein